MARPELGTPAAALALMVLAACGGGTAATAATPVVPVRAPTAGDALLTRLPPGAEVLVEVDLARLRANPTVGEIAAAVLTAPPALGDQPPPALVGATAVALAAYRVGTPEATTITIVAGGVRPAQALDLGETRWALAVEGDIAALLATAAGPSLADDAALLATRAWAMPAAADGAALRVTARLPVAARAALAAALDLDAAPAVVSAWGDVADDLALVIQLADQPPTARPPWLPALGRLRARLAATAELGALGLARPVADAALVRDAAGGVRVAVVIAPGRLRRAVARWRAAAPSSPVSSRLAPVASPGAQP